MMEKYFAFKFDLLFVAVNYIAMAIAVFLVVVAVVTLCEKLCEIWKDRRRKK